MARLGQLLLLVVLVAQSAALRIPLASISQRAMRDAIDRLGAHAPSPAELVPHATTGWHPDEGARAHPAG